MKFYTVENLFMAVLLYMGFILGIGGAQVLAFALTWLFIAMSLSLLSPRTAERYREATAGQPAWPLGAMTLCVMVRSGER